MQGDKIIHLTELIPGYSERISHNNSFTPELRLMFLDNVDEVFLSVETDDDIVITHKQRHTSTFGGTTKKPHTYTLSKHQINSHTIETPKSIRGRYASFIWVPSKTFISPDQEKVIQELIEQGVYTKEDAEAVRDNLIFQAQRDRLPHL